MAKLMEFQMGYRWVSNAQAGKCPVSYYQVPSTPSGLLEVGNRQIDENRQNFPENPGQEDL
jgi:hypothetical protein